MHADILGVYKRMLKIRMAESAIAKYYFENKIFSFVHFCVGQEFVPSLIAEQTRNSDNFFGNHRSHGHFIAKGGSVGSMFAEMLGKQSGSSKGYGGSMHMFEPEVGFAGTSPILSSNLPIALGDAFGAKESQSGTITVVFTGDGATEEGNFYETLNAAALWQVPLVVVIENNRYSVNSPIEKRRPPSFSHEKLANSFGLHFVQVREANILEDAANVFQIIELVRETGRPAVIQADSFRHMAHSAPIFDDQSPYRAENIASVRENHDILAKVRSSAIEGGTSEDLLLEIEKQIQEEIEKALEFAINDIDALPQIGFGD